MTQGKVGNEVCNILCKLITDVVIKSYEQKKELSNVRKFHENSWVFLYFS